MGEPGSSGATWVRGLDGRLTGELDVTPMDGADHWVRVRVTSGPADGLTDVGWTEGPFLASELGFGGFRVTVAPTVDGALASVWVVVEATDPSTGELVGAFGAPAVFAALALSPLSGERRWLDPDEARAAAGVPSLAAMDAAGQIDEQLVGVPVLAEVSP